MNARKGLGRRLGVAILLGAWGSSDPIADGLEPEAGQEAAGPLVPGIGEQQRPAGDVQLQEPSCLAGIFSGYQIDFTQYVQCP